MNAAIIAIFALLVIMLIVFQYLSRLQGVRRRFAIYTPVRLAIWFPIRPFKVIANEYCNTHICVQSISEWGVLWASRGAKNVCCWGGWRWRQVSNIISRRLGGLIFRSDCRVMSTSRRVSNSHTSLSGVYHSCIVPHLVFVVSLSVFLNFRLCRYEYSICW